MPCLQNTGRLHTWAAQNSGETSNRTHNSPLGLQRFPRGMRITKKWLATVPGFGSGPRPVLDPALPCPNQSARPSRRAAVQKHPSAPTSPAPSPSVHPEIGDGVLHNRLLLWPGIRLARMTGSHVSSDCGVILASRFLHFRSSPLQGRRRRWNTAVLGIAVLVVAVFVGLAYRQWQQYRQANLEAERSRQTVAALDSVLAALDDAETAQRGFLLTGESRYLSPYDRALQNLPGDLATLKNLLGGHPQETQQWNQLNTLAASKLDELRQTIQVRRARGAQRARAIVLTGHGDRTMDAIRALGADMKREENARQLQASGGGEAASAAILLITVGGSVVLLFLWAFAFEPFASPDPVAGQRSWLFRYGAGILAVVAITLIRAALTPLMGPTAMPFTLYFCAIAFAAWFGGPRPAALSVVLSLLAGSWFFATPTRSFLVGRHDDQVAMLMIVLVGFGIALLSRSQRDAVERALRAETSHRRERQHFETILAGIGDGVVATDGEGRVTFLNKVASTLLQWTPEEAQGQPLDQVFRTVHESTRAAAESPLTRVLRERQIVAGADQTLLLAKDGTEIPVDQSAAPIFGPQGDLVGAVLVFRDITEKRAAEMRLAEQSAELRRQAEVIEHAQLLVRGMDDRIRTWNRGAQELYGFSAAEAIGQVSHLLLKTQFPVPLPAIRSRLMNAGEWAGELTHTKRDGKTVTVASHWTLHRNNDGHPVAILEVNTDITERRRIEEALNRERERLGIALTAGRMGAFEVNTAGEMSWWSSEAYALFGVSPAQFRPASDSLAALIHPGDRELFLQDWSENIAHQREFNREFRILTSEGKERWISCRALPKYASSGRPVRYSGIFLDITERKETERVLRRFERLSAASRLSAAIAHGINNPLGAVANLVYLAKAAPGVPASVVELLDQAEQEVERVAHATRQALGFYRDSSPPVQIEIPELIDSVLRVCSSKIAEKKISVERKFLLCDPVCGAAGEIRQVFSNLLANAIEAVEEGGIISVGARSMEIDGQRSVEIVIADDGRGIAPEHLEHIFEPFFTTKSGTGTGLGLWVAKEIVERHHGSIEFRSPQTAGARGAKFRVRLPVGSVVFPLAPPVEQPGSIPSPEPEPAVDSTAN